MVVSQAPSSTRIGGGKRCRLGCSEREKVFFRQMACKQRRGLVECLLILDQDANVSQARRDSRTGRQDNEQGKKRKGKSGFLDGDGMAGTQGGSFVIEWNWRQAPHAAEGRDTRVCDPG